jgi:hypothetical protein
MNKIQTLINDGTITDNDVQEYISSNQEQVEQEELNNDWWDQERNFYGTEYVIASTSELMEETMVFPANKEAEIVSYSDLVCISARGGYDDWRDAFAAVLPLNTDEYIYTHVKTIHTERGNVHALFKKVKVADNVVI